MLHLDFETLYRHHLWHMLIFLVWNEVEINIWCESFLRRKSKTSYWGWVSRVKLSKRVGIKTWKLLLYITCVGYQRIFKMSKTNLQDCVKRCLYALLNLKQKTASLSLMNSTLIEIFTTNLAELFKVWRIVVLPETWDSGNTKVGDPFKTWFGMSFRWDIDATTCLRFGDLWNKKTNLKSLIASHISLEPASKGDLDRAWWGGKIIKMTYWSFLVHAFHWTLFVCWYW